MPPEERPREERRREERHHEERREERSRTRPHEERDRHEQGHERERSRPRRPVLDARDAARSAARHVEGLTGRAAEGVTSLERGEDGWVIGIEVVETHRIPDSTDILAEYQVELDDHGELASYRRTERYYRGRGENT
ncbi:gas vesicle protein [Streptomyces antimycoticus]|uniref:Gas vesicle protein n=3 Tax=Streptomyces TaxID=1883 RepID=A0ABD5J3K1_9ACTN|nr:MULTISPECIES: gas vesicle protein [Streptomyces]MEE4581889.1 gas vesicle protein [Streptomyces sp. DSM 41602]AJZ83758.1 gas vesicle protein [Streptomyces sp. AgN23]KUL50656.1 gas vesicle protein [Streptomyces violaceusniger]RSS49287.1 gas vesicle protein [Streptomyces sp. WAC05858]WTA85570.1 gas vesicle protein [Streptomyces antimycoticus]